MNTQDEAADMIGGLYINSICVVNLVTELSGRGTTIINR